MKKIQAMLRENSIMLSRFLLITLFFGGTVSSVYAQNEGEDELSSDEIVIEKEFEGIIKDARRIKLVPEIPEQVTEKKEQTYSMDPKAIDTRFEPNKLRPVALAKTDIPKYNESFIKAGFGPPLFPYAELVYNDNNIENLRFGARYRHLSIKGKKFKRMSDNLASAYVEYALKKMSIGADFDFDRDVHHYYAIPQSDSSIDRKDIQSKVRNTDGSVWFKTNSDNKAGLNFKQSIAFNHTHALEYIKEREIVSVSHFHKVIKKKHHAELEVDLNFSNLVHSEEIKRKILQFRLGYTFNNGDWKLAAAVIPLMEDSVFRIFPHFITEKQLFKRHLIFYSGWNMEIQKNGYRDFIVENPFVLNEPSIRNTRIEKRQAGLKGSIKNFGYNLQFMNKVVRQLPLYVNDSSDTKRFDIVYDKRTNILDFHLELNAKIKRNFTAGIKIDYFTYETDNQEKAWHQPAFRSDFIFGYNFKNKITARVDVFGLTGAYARLPDGSAKKLKGIADVNLSAEYHLNEMLLFFVELHNIAAIKHERWYNYPTFGFNGLVGAQLSF